MSQNRIAILLLCWTINILAILPSENAPVRAMHDTPDGFVERAVAVVIRDRTLELTVQIGINEKTMRDEFARWNIDGEFENETEVTNQYCAEIQERLVPRFALSLDEEPLELQITSVEPFAEHHKTAVMKLTAEIPESLDAAKLTLTDSTFLQMDGAVRYAIKGRGSVLITQSSAAPIIIRADRIELGKLSEEERLKACQLTANVKIVSR